MFGLALVFTWIRYIPNTRVGIVEKLVSAKGSVKSGLIALEGEAGFQPYVLRGGWHFLTPFQYRVHRMPLVTIPQGKIGYLFARDGQPLPPTQTLACNTTASDFEDVARFLAGGGQRGPQRKILREGTYAINLAQFVVLTEGEAALALHEPGDETVGDHRLHPALGARDDQPRLIGLGPPCRRVREQAGTVVGALADADVGERHADRAQVAGQHIGVVVGLLLVQMHGDEFEAHRRLGLQLAQDVEQRVRILAAGKADHDAVAVLDHVVVGDGLPDLAAQALGQLVGFDRTGKDRVHGLAGRWLAAVSARVSTRPIRNRSDRVLFWGALLECYCTGLPRPVRIGAAARTMRSAAWPRTHRMSMEDLAEISRHLVELRIEHRDPRRIGSVV